MPSARRSFSSGGIPQELQQDAITIVDTVPETKNFIGKIDKLHQRPVLRDSHCMI